MKDIDFNSLVTVSLAIFSIALFPGCDSLINSKSSGILLAANADTKASGSGFLRAPHLMPHPPVKLAIRSALQSKMERVKLKSR